MINLFIDTNVFLSFYHLTSEDIEELKKLAALIDQKEILLFLPEQVKAEFYRNRAGKIQDAIRKLQETKFNLSFPLFAKDYTEYDQLRSLMKKADVAHAALVKNIMTDAELEQLSADAIVSSLFSKANNISATDVLYFKALKRVQLGNPPGKEGSLGDAMNWECLLSAAPKNEDIYIVSADRDFRSKLLDDHVNEFLFDEWSNQKGSTLHFYSKISDFFKTKYPAIKIASEVEKDLLIQKLAASGSFATTHVVIGALSKYSQFSSTQAEQLVEILKSNNQVGLIIGDADVYAFFFALFDKNKELIAPQAATDLGALLASNSKDQDTAIPF